MNSFGNNLISFVVIHDTEKRTHKSTDMFEKGSYCYSLQAKKKTSHSLTKTYVLKMLQNEHTNLPRVIPFPFGSLVRKHCCRILAVLVSNRLGKGRTKCMPFPFLSQKINLPQFASAFTYYLKVCQ